MLEPIFTAKVQQQVFRALLTAQSFPGRVQHLNMIEQRQAFRAMLAALLDGEVSLCDVNGLLSEEKDWAFLEAQYRSSDSADFILVKASQYQPIHPKLGSLGCPDQSATLILVVESLTLGESYQLAGPGIETQQSIRVQGLNAQWLAQRDEWNVAFPMGVDMFLVDSDQNLVALPRTTKIKVE